MTLKWVFKDTHWIEKKSGSKDWIEYRPNGSVLATHVFIAFDDVGGPILKDKSKNLYSRLCPTEINRASILNDVMELTGDV